MSARFQGKVVVIAGAGEGMGRTAALKFAAEGARIVACSTDPKAGEATERAVRDAGGEIECLYPLDLTREDEVRRLMDHAAAAFGGVDILYVNAHRLALGLPGQMTLEAFERTLKYTLTLQWLCAKHAIPHMKHRPGAAMVLISSAAALPYGTGFLGNHGNNFAYGIAKAGVNRLAVLLAVELSPLGIRVNSLSSGMVASKDNNLIKPLHEEWTKQFLIPRPGRPEEVVGSAMFLCSEDAGFITGQNLVVDGGWVASMGRGQPDGDVAARVDAMFGQAYAHDAPAPLVEA